MSRRNKKSKSRKRKAENALFPVFPDKRYEYKAPILTEPHKMPPVLLTGMDFTRLDLSRLPEGIRLVVEHGAFQTTFARQANVINAISHIPKNDDLSEVERQVAKIQKGTLTSKCDSDTPTDMMLRAVETMWRHIIANKTLEMRVNSGNAAGASDGAEEKKLATFRRSPKMHSAQGDLEMELADFKRLDCTTFPLNEMVGIVSDGAVLFTLVRFEDRLRAFRVDVRMCSPSDEKYRGKWLLVQCVEEPEVLVADPIKLGVSVEWPPGMSQLAVSWTLEMPLSHPVADILRDTEQKAESSRLVARELVPCLDDPQTTATDEAPLSQSHDH